MPFGVPNAPLSRGIHVRPDPLVLRRAAPKRTPTPPARAGVGRFPLSFMGNP